MRKICVLLIAVISFAGFADYVESGVVSSDGYELLDTCSYAAGDMSELNKVELIKARTCIGMMAGIKQRSLSSSLKNIRKSFTEKLMI
jgi:hypothetical protein